jgi:hypothetical protein
VQGELVERIDATTQTTLDHQCKPRALQTSPRQSRIESAERDIKGPDLALQWHHAIAIFSRVKA